MGRPLDKRVFKALADAVLNDVQNRFHDQGYTPAEIMPVLIEALVSLAFYTARDGTHMGQLAFIGLCTTVVLHIDPEPLTGKEESA